jgi:FixJ family two-component response regulator
MFRVSSCFDAGQGTKTRLTRLDALNPRERKVFGFVVSRMLNRQVACDLGIAEKTVSVQYPYR